MTRTKDRRFERLLPSQIIAEMAERPLVFLPLGPLEWHGPHLPLGTDAMIAYQVALRVADRIGGVVLPPLYCGTERERTSWQLKHLGFNGEEWIVGMDFPANGLKSLYLREEFFALQVREMIDLLMRQGYRLIALINGHGATNHISVLDRLAAEFTAERQAQVLHFTAWGNGEPETEGSGHADASETSQMMALHPELVHLEQLPPLSEPLRYVDYSVVDGSGFDGHPTPDFTVRDDPRSQATPERGERELGSSIAYIARKLAAALQGLGYKPA